MTFALKQLEIFQSPFFYLALLLGVILVGLYGRSVSVLILSAFNPARCSRARWRKGPKRYGQKFARRLSIRHFYLSHYRRYHHSASANIYSEQEAWIRKESGIGGARCLRASALTWRF